MNAVVPHNLEKTVKDYIATLKCQAIAGTLATYLICDPTEEDVLHRSSFGTPFYVGQGDFVSRARNHLRCRSARSTRKRITAIYKKGTHPLFFVVDRARTRLASLKSEMDWACHLIDLGYSLTNGWREHKSSRSLRTVPVKRVWQFSVDEAITDLVKLRVQCRACGLRRPLPLDDMSWSNTVFNHLNQARNSFLCPECSAPRCLRIDVPPVEAPSVPNLDSVLEALCGDLMRKEQMNL